MNKLIIIFFLTSIGCVLHKQKRQENDSSFLRYLAEKQTMKEIGAIYMQDSFDSTTLINKHDSLRLKCNLQFKYSSLYSIYNYLGDSVKSKQYFKKAVAHGYFSKNYNGAESERQRYLNSISLSTLNILKYIDSIDVNARTYHYDKIKDVDSITLHLLDSLISVNNGNWLDIDKTGNISFYSIKPNEYFDKTIAIHHMEEEDNHRYFDLILKACKEGNEDWSCVVGIKWQQLIRFKHPAYTNYDFIKLRRLKINKNELDIKDDETLLTIHEVSNIIRSNLSTNISFIIYPTNIIKNKDYKNIGEDLMKQLSDFGVTDQTTFSSEIMPMDSLEKVGNDYPFVVKIVNK